MHNPDDSFTHNNKNNNEKYDFFDITKEKPLMEFAFGCH